MRGGFGSLGGVERKNKNTVGDFSIRFKRCGSIRVYSRVDQVRVTENRDSAPYSSVPITPIKTPSSQPNVATLNSTINASPTGNLDLLDQVRTHLTG